MAYAAKYRINDVYWNHDSSQSFYRLLIYEDGFGGSVTTLTPTESPLILNIRGQRDTADTQAIYGSELEFEFIVDKTDVSTYDSDFLESDYQDLVVRLIEDPSGAFNIKWVGYLRPENSSREWFGNKYVYRMSATDGLADLKNFYYTETGYSNGAPYKGFEDMLTVIKTSLGKLFTDSIMQRPFRIQLGTYSNEMTSTENVFKENEIAQELFWSYDTGKYDYDTCYDVISKILTPFNCTLKQVEGYFWIQNRQERQSYYFEYDWSTLTQQSRTYSDLNVSITNYNFFNRGQLYKIAPPNRYNVTLYNKEYTTALITNGDFTSNITGWTNGDADNSSNSFSSLAWYDYTGVGGTMGASYSGSATAAKYNFHTTSSITLDYGTGAGNLTVSVEIELNSETRTGGASAIPLFQIRLWNSTDGYVSGSAGQYPFYSVGGFYTFTEVFDMTSVSVAASYLDFEVETQDSTTTAFQTYVDSIKAEQFSANTPRDWKYYSSRSTGTQIQEKENTIYIAESQESTSDLCSIKDTGGSYVTDFCRYGKTENLKLAEALQQQYFNDNDGYKNYIKVSIYDPNETINAHNFLGMDSDRYFIVGMKKDYREGTVDVDMIQTKSSDVTINQYSGKLNTQYGKEIS